MGGRGRPLLEGAPSCCLARPALRRSDFRTETVLGAGAFATVELCEYVPAGAYVALKVIQRRVIGGSARHAACVRDEVACLGRCSAAPFVAALFASFEDDGAVYLVCEAAPDGPLLEGRGGGVAGWEGGFAALPACEAALRLAEVAAALAHVHADCGVAHRDVSAGNVLSGPDGSARLCDFGCAVALASPGDRRSTACGTDGYAAPEVARGRYLPRDADLFSFGAFASLALLGGGPRPDAASLEARCDAHGLPPTARDLLRGLLDKNPKTRLGAPAATSTALLAHPFFDGVDALALAKKGKRPRRAAAAFLDAG